MSRSWPVLRNFILTVVNTVGYIFGVTNLGSGAQVAASIVSGNLRLRSIVQGAGILVTQSATEITIATSVAAGPRSQFFYVDPNSNYNNYRTRSINAGGAFRFVARIPDDVGTITRIALICAPIGGAAGPAKDIDILCDFAAEGENVVANSQNDTTTLYDFSGMADDWVAIDLTTLLTGGTPSLSPGDILGIQVDHNGIGGSIQYAGIQLEYTPP